MKSTKNVLGTDAEGRRVTVERIDGKPGTWAVGVYECLRAAPVVWHVYRIKADALGDANARIVEPGHPGCCCEG